MEDDRYRHTRQARATRIPGCPLGRPGALHTALGQDTPDGHRRPRGPGHPGRTRPRVLGSRRGARDLTVTSRLSQLQVRCPRLPRRERQARLWPAFALQPQAIGPVPAKIVVPLARSYLIRGMQIRGMTCRNVVRGKTTSWLHDLGRERRTSRPEKITGDQRAITVDVGATESPNLGGSNHGIESSGWAPDRRDCARPFWLRSYRA